MIVNLHRHSFKLPDNKIEEFKKICLQKIGGISCIEIDCMDCPISRRYSKEACFAFNDNVFTEIYNQLNRWNNFLCNECLYNNTCRVKKVLRIENLPNCQKFEKKD